MSPLQRAVPMRVRRLSVSHQGCLEQRAPSSASPLDEISLPSIKRGEPGMEALPRASLWKKKSQLASGAVRRTEIFASVIHHDKCQGLKKTNVTVL